MAGVLQFTLGLEASQFLHNCGLSSGAIFGLEKAGEGLHQVMERVWGSIESATALEHLSKRTGETAGNLYAMQAAFQACGVGSDSLSTMIFQMQKSLGGVNEAGETTDDTFKRLGLNLKDLKTAGASGAMTQIVGALGKLDQTSAAKAASGIFGRMGAGSAVQLSRSPDEFREMLAAAGPQAAIMDRISKSAAAIQRTLQTVKMQFTGLFAGIAEGAMPMIQSVMDTLKGIDLTSIGEKLGAALGDAASILGQAFKEGDITELLSAVFEAAVERLGNLVFGVLGDGGLWSGVWDVMVGSFWIKLAVIGKAFVGLGTILEAGITSAFNVLLEWIGKIPKLGKYLGLENYKADSFGETYSRMKEENAPAQKMLSGILGEGLGQSKKGLGNIGAALARANAASGGEAQDHLAELIGGLRARAPKKIKAQIDLVAGTKDMEFGKTPEHHTEGNAFEKMGFNMGGGGPAATTATNTGKMVDLIAQVRDAILSKDTTDAAHAETMHTFM